MRVDDKPGGNARGIVTEADLYCGPGRPLRALRQLGWQVTGLEPQPSYLRGGRRNCRSDAGHRAFELIAAIK